MSLTIHACKMFRFKIKNLLTFCFCICQTPAWFTLFSLAIKSPHPGNTQNSNSFEWVWCKTKLMLSMRRGLFLHNPSAALTSQPDALFDCRCLTQIPSCTAGTSSAPGGRPSWQPFSTRRRGWGRSRFREKQSLTLLRCLLLLPTPYLIFSKSLHYN